MKNTTSQKPIRGVSDEKHSTGENLKDITPIKYQIENIFSDIDSVGELDYSKDEKMAIIKLEKLFQQAIDQAVKAERESIIEDLEVEHQKELERTVKEERQRIFDEVVKRLPKKIERNVKEQDRETFVELMMNEAYNRCVNDYTTVLEEVKSSFGRKLLKHLT